MQFGKLYTPVKGFAGLLVSQLSPFKKILNFELNYFLPHILQFGDFWVQRM